MSNKRDTDMPELLEGELPEGTPVMSEEEEAQLKKKNKKKRMIAGIAIFAAIGIVSGVLLALEPWAKSVFGETLGMYGSNKSYSNYTPDYDLDVTTVISTVRSTADTMNIMICSQKTIIRQMSRISALLPR